jgi:hypothetical protein
LKSIEHHMKFNDPERHKTKLLEMIQEERMDKDEKNNGQDITTRN